jgi:hypothetical protein
VYDYFGQGRSHLVRDGSGQPDTTTLDKVTSTSFVTEVDSQIRFKIYVGFYIGWKVVLLFKDFPSLNEY